MVPITKGVSLLSELRFAEIQLEKYSIDYRLRRRRGLISVYRDVSEKIKKVYDSKCCVGEDCGKLRGDRDDYQQCRVCSDNPLRR